MASRLQRRAPAPVAPPRAERDAVVVLESARCEDPSTLVVRGWAYVEGAEALAVVSVVAVGPRGEVVADGHVNRVNDAAADLYPGDKRASHADAVFEATLDLTAVRDGRLVVEAVSRDGGALVRRPFATRPPSSPSRHLRASGAMDGANVKLAWSDEDGLVLTRTAVAAVLSRCQPVGDALLVEVKTGDGAELALLGEGAEAKPRPVGMVTEGIARATLTADDNPSPRRMLVAVRADGSAARVVLPAGWSSAEATAADGLRLVPRPSGAAELRRGPVLSVTAVEITATSITISGLAAGLPAGAILELRGSRTRVMVDLDASCGDVVVVIPTTVRDWYGERVPLPSGRYRVWVASDGVEAPVELSSNLVDPGGGWVGSDEVRLRLLRGRGDRMVVESSPPLADDERSDRAQAILEHRYATSSPSPRRVAYFECYYGTSATDSARAIHEELRRRGSDLELVWGVEDRSVVVPEGGRAVVRGSREWWEVLAHARFLTFNAGLPYGLRRREGQTVVQTWHGTPFKRLGSDRPGFDDPSTAMVRSVARWDALLAGNPHSAEVFGRVWGYHGPIHQLGYPRNDALARAGATDVAGARRTLGIDDDRLVVLYVPTWRDGNRVMDQLLDTEALVSGVGREVTVLVRGHMNISGWSTRIGGHDVLDVTGYPEINDLFLAADVAVTDYSSIMFDYSVTGKPLVFFVPDLDDYRDRRRGTYLDLEESGPGPAVRTTEQVIDVLRDLDSTRVRFAERYAAWVATFNPLDDGRAAARVVDALYEAR
ncbi:CDP-glycerol glycerophosphotransferase family protein [Mumia sp. Pv 4-285]|uniref:CDP-glycerol glycerophosphotransferase family protein n=1 Tax=Mumia qirimensis TaxID=3234852 RepID=UPI00351D65D0